MLSKCRMLGIAVMMTALLAGSAWAAFRPKVAVDQSGEGATLTINSRPAVRFKTNNGLLAPLDRAAVTAQRLSDLVANGLDARILSVKATKRQARIYASDTMICVATAADAKANRTTPGALANSWAANMRGLLLMPAIELSAKRLLIPLGENRSIIVSGAAVGPIYTKASDAAVISAAGNDNSRAIQIAGLKVGSGTVEISVEGERTILNVDVRKYAGRAADLAGAQVTGNPCPVLTIRTAASQAVMQSITVEPGAKAEFGEVDCKGGSLPRGASRRVEAEVRITGDGYIPYRAKAPVQIDNMSMPRELVQQLFYSNNPERLLKYQTLFAGRIDVNQVTRVLFHHQNDMGKRAHFIVELINPSSTAASIRVFSGISTPQVDTILVGYAASSAFLKGYSNDVSIIEKIPPMSRLILVSDRLAHNETTSGVLEMQQLSGDSVYVRITSNPPGLDDVRQGQIAQAPNPLLLSLSEHIYPAPVKTVSAEYVVGQRWAFVPIGKHAVTDASAQKMLYGNYGVTYNIEIKVHNPTSETKKVTVAFDPTAGVASGVFMIDGAFVATRYANPPDDVPLATYKIKPGEVKTLQIMTLPVAGSNYPATLVVRS